jgi:acetyl esterase/lipase
VKRPVVALVLWAAMGCGPMGASADANDPQAGFDAGLLPVDSGAVTDSGVDAGPFDAGAVDAGAIDAGVRCSGLGVTHRDLLYGSRTQDQSLDLYLPQTGAACPVIVWIHGGGWMSGSKALQAGAVQNVLRQVPRGFALASIDYRLSDVATFPAQLHDVKGAIRWLRANAQTYRLDPSRIVLWGTSAGGHLAALAGTTGTEGSLEGTVGPPGSSQVQGVIDCYGPTALQLMDQQLRCGSRHDAPDSAESKFLGCTNGLQSVECNTPARLANPITWISNATPSFLVGHGTADCTVPIGQSELLVAALRDAGVPVGFHERDGGAHRIESCPDEAVIDGFLEQWR